MCLQRITAASGLKGALVLSTAEAKLTLTAGSVLVKVQSQFIHVGKYLNKTLKITEKDRFPQRGLDRNASHNSLTQPGQEPGQNQNTCSRFSRGKNDKCSSYNGDIIGPICVSDTGNTA